MDAQKFNNTLLVMNEEIELLKSLQKNLAQQKDMIFNSKAEDFSHMVRIEEDLLSRIRKVDSERLIYINQISLEYKMDSQLTITKLIELVDEPYKKRFKTIKKVFVDLIEDIRKLNLENRFLVKKSMVFVQKNLNVLKDFTKNDYIYSTNGGYGNVHTPVKRLLDQSI